MIFTNQINNLVKTKTYNLDQYIIILVAETTHVKRKTYLIVRN